MGSCWHSSLSNSISFNLYLRFLFLSQFESLFISGEAYESIPSGHNHARPSSGNSISLLSLFVTSKEQTQASIPSNPAPKLITYHRRNKTRTIPPASITFLHNQRVCPHLLHQSIYHQLLWPHHILLLIWHHLLRHLLILKPVQRLDHNITFLPQKTIQLSCPASWQCYPAYLQASSKAHKP